MNTTRIAAGLAALLAAVCAAAPAHASVDEPTAGDRITYTFFSDVPDNQSLTWFDANDDIAQNTSPHLPERDASGRYWGTVTFVSQSTYQSVVGSIQTDGYLAGCTAIVNGTVIGTKTATGRYAVASCSAVD